MTLSLCKRICNKLNYLSENQVTDQTCKCCNNNAIGYVKGFFIIKNCSFQNGFLRIFSAK